jgi:hypothetical protein
MRNHSKIALSAMLVSAVMGSRGALAADRWSEAFDISGTGVSDCGSSRVTAVTWDRCRGQAATASTITGVPVSVVDIWYSYTRTDEEGPFWDHWHSCKFSGKAQCLFRIGN